VAYFSPGPAAGDPYGVSVDYGIPPISKWARVVRRSWSLATRLDAEHFDRAVAARLPVRGGTFVGFVGQALHSFRRARAVGWHRLALVAANSHPNNVLRRHAAALAEYPLETSWLDRSLAAKMRLEYELADVIYANSDYTRDSLIAEGIPPSKIVRQFLTPDPRYVPPPNRCRDGVFRIVYVGSVTVMKGIPWLIEAFHRARLPNAQLKLLGGWCSRGMKLYLQKQMLQDPRIRVTPCDPLEDLRHADLCVHPSFEDGFGYGPAEALACGLPVVTTEDTGMKECITEGVNGFIVRAGDTSSLTECIAGAANRERRSACAISPRQRA